MSAAKPIVIVGAGGFGRKVADVIERINAAALTPEWNLVGFIDDDPAQVNLERLKRRSLPFLGPLGVHSAGEGKHYYISAIGSPSSRKLLADQMDASGFLAATLVDPGALIGSDVEIGEGSVVCFGAALDTNTRIGRHCQVGFNMIMGHDAVVGDFVSLSPLCAVSGDCVIGDGVLLGVGAIVMLQRRVGNEAVVGANACVSTDIPSGAVVKGVPAR